jgi:monomeric isocitrate dehydrogenase
MVIKYKFPEDPKTTGRKKLKPNIQKGSAVNPVLREGNLIVET